MELHEDLLKSLLETKDDSILIDLKSLGDILLVKLTGYIDTYNSNYFINQINKIYSRPFNTLCPLIAILHAFKVDWFTCRFPYLI